MRKELMKTIHERVSSVMNLFVALKVEVGKSGNETLERELRDAKTTCNDSNKVEEEILPETSVDREGEQSTPEGGLVLPPHKHSLKQNHKLYSDIVTGR